MKNIKYSILIGCILAFVACKNENYNLYSDENGRIGFSFFKYTDSTTSYTFAYSGKEITRDTIYLPVITNGFVRDRDRAYEVEQLEPKNINNEKAISGVHFVPLDDTWVKSEMVIKAGAVVDSIPIIMLRTNLPEAASVELRVRIKENSEFIGGVYPNIEKRLEFSNILVKPKDWDRYGGFLGTYGKEKHQLMINVMPGTTIDNDWLLLVKSDMGYCYSYLRPFFQDELNKENKRRAEKGLGDLREKPTTEGGEGILVKFM